MQTLTFTKMLLRQRRFLNSLLPLFAVFIGLGFSQQALAQTPNASIISSSITLTQRPTASSTAQNIDYVGSADDVPYTGYTPLNVGSASPTTTPALGTYDLNNNSQLTLNAASIVGAIVSSGTTLNNAAVEYRVFLLSTLAGTEPAYSPLSLTQQGTSTTYSTTGAGINLLSALSSGGNYVLQVRFRVNATRGVNNKVFYDLSNGLGSADNYTAVFYVTPPPFTPAGGTTTWLSTTSTDWNVAANWSNGVPTATSNAVINDPTSVQYAYPVLDSPTGGPINTYYVNNLTLNGNSGTIKAQLVVQLATLVVNGNIRQLTGGLRGATIGSAGVADPTRNSTLVLGGADQVISGQLEMPDVVVAGSGIKSVVNVMKPTNTLSFRPTSVANGVILQSALEDNINNAVVTVFSTIGNANIDLGNNALINPVAGYGETNSSYVKGVLRSTRRITLGSTQTFGNIGIEMTPNHTPVGQIVVSRVVGEAQRPPVGNGVAVKRLYTITGDDDSETSTYAGSGSFVRFRYLDSVDELNSISEANLLMFLSFNISGPYAPTYGVLNDTQNYYDRGFLASYPSYNLTLGDRTRPLPVRLTAFDAKRVGTDALVTWQTASEENSRGYDVQVSTNGTEFRTIASVPSASPNSMRLTDYRYVDTEAKKTGLRYYRLRQVDLDGTEAFFGPLTVSFEGKVSESSPLVAYPNPFGSGDKLSLEVQSATAGKAQLLISDMTGRTIRQESVEVATGITGLSVSNVSELKAGVYLVRLTLPTGETKNLKVVKQ